MDQELKNQYSLTSAVNLLSEEYRVDIITSSETFFSQCKA